MSKIFLNDGLIYTTVALSHKNKTIILKNALLDTGSSSTVISSEIANKLGLRLEPTDIINSVQGVGGSETVIEKVIDSIVIDTSTVKKFHIQIGAMDYGITLEAIIGLDLLTAFRSVIDLEIYMLTAS